MNAIIEMGIIAQNGEGGGGGIGPLWIGLILMLVVFYAVMLSGNRREKKKRQDMLAAIKRNDRVMTIGGIIGSVVSVGDNEIVLKIDESANVKVTLSRGAIQRVLADDEKPVDVK